MKDGFCFEPEKISELEKIKSNKMFQAKALERKLDEARRIFFG